MHTMNHPDFQRIPGDLCVYWIRGDNLPCSDQLIALAAEKWCTENGHTPFRADVLRPKFEKPRFVHAPDIHFSVSHSENYWVCIMDQHPVGIDLQFNQRVNAESIARRHFHPLEALWLEKHPEDFFRIWTAKEAFVKAVGLGIGRGIALTDVAVAHDELGAPHYALTGAALDKMQQMGAQHAWLSISHEGHMAAAVCVIE